jgi:glycosyltransferase involved in cell wall biosynthesis
MKLQILVPHYKETADVIKPLLDSIAIQQSVDFDEIGVIICHDGPEAKDFAIGPSAEPGQVDVNYYFNVNYPFEIEQIRKEHLGVSAARQACLDAATAEYVMFCDADDMFCSVFGLYIILREIQNGGFDSLVSCFTEETRNPQNKEEILYINREMDSTFVHGKVHRRAYLRNNNIRWNPALTIHEDSYFNCLCQRLSPEVKYCPIPFYLWKWRDESVCRHDPKYILKTYNNMLDSNTALVNEFISRRRMDDAKFFATTMIFDAYYTMNKKEWIDVNNKEYRDAVEKRFATYYRTFRNLYESLDEQVKTQIIAGVRTRMFGEGLMLESITFDDWIKRVLKED